MWMPLTAAVTMKGCLTSLAILVLLSPITLSEAPNDQIAIESSRRPFIAFSLPDPNILLPGHVEAKNLKSDAFLKAVNSPKVQSLEVTCNANSMKVQISFSKAFAGVIYSKGHYSRRSCRYVTGDRIRRTFEFVIRHDSCGSHFADAGRSKPYLENVIIIQNEATLQKAADSARKIRCLWKPDSRNTEKVVRYNLNVDNLDQKVVTFDQDTSATANAVMDIQIGEGPYAPSVDGLVKIGDVLTMVVEANGSPDLDVHVRECLAHNGDGSAQVELTDLQGCVMKPNLLSPWIKSKEAESESVMAYSYFQAFKFPEQMDVVIECSLDLCKGECDICSSDAEQIAEALRTRRRRAVNATSGRPTSPVKLARRLRVVSPEDIALTEGIPAVTPIGDAFHHDTICLSVMNFVIGLVIILILLFVSSIVTAVLCVRVRSGPTTVATYPDNSFHAFSTVSGKP